MAIKKKSIWQPRLFRLGLLLTLMVIIADWGKLLNTPENLLYDRRARSCQYFMPPPTDRIVHVDIDDDSLNDIGHWPWPGAKLAKIIDEISLAKPKVVGLDMYFPEAAPNESDDNALAASIKRAGNVMLPISIEFNVPTAPDPLLFRMEHLLLDDLELSPDQIIAALQQAGMDRSDLTAEVWQKLNRARKMAMMQRLDKEITAGVTDLPTLRKKLVPRFEDSSTRSDASKLFDESFPKEIAIHATERFRLPLPQGIPMYSAPGERAINIQKLAEAARYSGFIDLPPSSVDGAVRSVPLMVNYRGSAFPHMALGMACALLNVDFKDIRCTADSIILPVPDRDPITIPVRVERSSNLGDVGAILDVPYFGKAGGDNWLTMYDYPRHQQPVAHLKIDVFWTIHQLADSIQTNNTKADKILQDIATGISSTAAAKYLKQIPDPSDTDARLSAIDATLKEMSELAGDAMAKPEKDLTDDEKSLVLPLRGLADIARINHESQSLLIKDRLDLQHQLQGKAIFVGWAAEGNGDVYATSLYPQCPGAVIQGVIVNGILTQELWRRSPHWVTALITLAIGMLTCFLVTILPPWRALFCTLLVMVGYVLINGEILFDYGNWVVGAAGPLIASALVLLGLTLINFINEAAERRRIRKSFSNYVDPALVEFVEEHPDQIHFAGERREMTVVFTDLAGFTTISETLGERTVALLNSYFGKMVPIIRENHGYVNKFLGDGLMFFYGAPRENPNHAADAVRTVIQMRKALDPFNESLRQSGLPSLGMRAGITSGQMLVGDAGSRSDDERHNAADYTVLGDKVNLAARFESANKFFGSNLLINQLTRDLIGDRFLLRPIGKITVTGKSENVMTYEPLCELSEATPQQILHAQLSTKIVEAFQAAQFNDCLLLCDELESKTPDPQFAATYRKLSQKHLSAGTIPPFDGRIILNEK
ncbi:MAG TPA: adenylate/guanylate cyclase domain-containing protein [Tepidisphaeraceae bacterium]|jgi:class 3 adenylate cyclase|nr:adenylate/guanylate cyclase domain-containing protein [Tepidisphaeraceae bacterium]